MRFLDIFRRTDIRAAAREMGKLGAAARISAERQLRREMTNRLRADLRAKGHNLPHIDWEPLL